MQVLMKSPIDRDVVQAQNPIASNITPNLNQYCFKTKKNIDPIVCPFRVNHGQYLYVPVAQLVGMMLAMAKIYRFSLKTNSNW